MAENEYKEVDDHEGADHAVTMTLTLADTTPELFTHNVQMAFKYDIAHGLNHGHGEEQQTYGHGIKPSQVSREARGMRHPPLRAPSGISALPHRFPCD